VVGELDLMTAATLRAEHERVLARGSCHVVVDLRDLEFIDVAGLGALLALTAQARRDGWRLSLIQGPSAVRRLFELTGTLHALPFTLPPSAAAV
jgi:anti-sigma B factor antagonist